MGLDAVELVMDIEEAFDIQIPDERAAEIATVGQLYDVILEAGPTRSLDGLCMSAATFRLIRRAMQSEFGLDVRRLRPRDSVTQCSHTTGDNKLGLDYRTLSACDFQRWLARIGLRR